MYRMVFSKAQFILRSRSDKTIWKHQIASSFSCWVKCPCNISQHAFNHSPDCAACTLCMWVNYASARANSMLSLVVSMLYDAKNKTCSVASDTGANSNLKWYVGGFALWFVYSCSNLSECPVLTSSFVFDLIFSVCSCKHRLSPFMSTHARNVLH